MLRVMVCIMIVLLSFAGGYLYSWRFTGRLLIINDVKEKFNSMEREIMFSMDTLPEICRDLSKEEGPFSKVFTRICEGLAGEGDSFAELWSEGVKKEFSRSSLKKDQVEGLALLGKGLGKGDIEEQKKCFARINAELERLLSEAREESSRLKKMYMSLFVSGGLAVSIILI